MPSSCRRCCCAVRSGQQVLMCAGCFDVVHVRCLPVSAEEADKFAAQARWECVVCEAKRTAVEEESLLATLERRQELDDRLNGLLERLIALQHEQNDLNREIGEAAYDLSDAGRRLSDVDRDLGALEAGALALQDASASKNCSGSDGDPVDNLDTATAATKVAKSQKRKVSLTNLGVTRGRSFKMQKLPKMSLCLGHIVSQLIVT